MVKQYLVLLFAMLLVIETNSTAIKNVKPKATVVSPYDLIDGAQAQLEELRVITNGAIDQANVDLDAIVTSAATEQSSVFNNGEIAINQGFETINEDLTTIKDLALEADLDISICLSASENVLGLLPDFYIDELSADCLEATNVSLNGIIRDSQYFVDVAVTEVNSLEFQLDRCDAGSILCILPVVTQVELLMIQLPQKIQVEVDRADNFFQGWKSGIWSCQSMKVNVAVREGNAVLQKISDCVNDLSV